jgi:hypothetical protein
MYRTEIVCDNMIFLNNSNNSAPELKDDDAPPSKVQKEAKERSDAITKEDIPF